jgi:hypothetical protein
LGSCPAALCKPSSPNVKSLKLAVDRLANAIGSSKLLFKSRDWADELMAHVAFYPGKDWLDA